ncbi:TIGR02391 family protein [Methylobacterium sp. J-088]|uniref:TIGR02391 family protein n=1 Tax=Methylobacterium sp. J-088 TaxID=2836664 RepID=UPI001FB9FC12|nr:TIGR02391 family protein [Methylobacterium sp. J-088]MCJ2063133.1 TIGR02391 family protein [Methylobacterium sp. J-088]
MLPVIAFAREISAIVKRVGLGGQPLLSPPKRTITLAERYLASVKDEELRRHTESRFSAGHYQDAVLEAFKYVNNYIKRRVRIPGQDGVKLMELAFSPNSPILCLNEFYSASQKDEQAGYMRIFAGAMQGVRNPRAHENEFDDDPERALELLSLANHLLEKAKIAKKKRKKTAADPK